METVEEWKAERSEPLTSGLAVAQGVFYIATGVWPIVHLRSFETVTGPKLEGWLVKTVGALIAVVGGTLLAAGLRRRVSSELKMLATGSAASLAAVDVIYSPQRISPVYLLDAVAEGVLITGWCVATARARKRRSIQPPPPRYTSPEDAAGFPT
ncbi:hypothetical protein JRI60_51010 [Archangium violaceum]|uniref:hypothetical protein n=1 Tax=Archangium violaceum TaxID=83451 RepID=UPI001950A2E1|nr:hypothetical protein [Archangium violaceum]QRN97189.1 hypothetical protein JRI60_51010 [Archangium violaceum]